MILFLLFFHYNSFSQINNEVRRGQRAIFIFNFTNYFNWQNIDRIKVFQIGVLGDDPLYDNLKEMAKSRLVKGKPIQIVKFNEISEIGKIQLLYVNKVFNFEIKDILKQTTGKNILLVSENYRFQESMINIIDTDNVIQFELNEGLLRSEGFQPPGSLSKLAVTSGEVWQQLYRQSEISLSTEREKVAQQQRVLDELSSKIKMQERELDLRKEELTKQEELIKKQKDTIAYQLNEISKRVAAVDSLHREYENKQLLLDGLESVIKEHLSQLDQQKNELLDQKRSISEQDSILSTQIAQIQDQRTKITAQEEDLTQKQTQLSYQRNLIYISIGFVVILLVLSIYIYRGYRYKQKSNKELEQKNSEIEEKSKQLEERNLEIQEYAYLIKKREANLESLLENTTDVIWSIDANKKFITFNEAFYELMTVYMGISPKISEKFQLKDLPEEIAPFWIELYTRALKGERFVEESSMVLGERSITYELFFNPINEEGNVTGVSVFGRDITTRIIERRNKEKFQEGLKLLNYLASQTEIGFDALSRKALDLVKNLLQLPVGVICEVSGSEYKIVQYDAQKQTVNVDKSYPMEGTLIEKIYLQDKILHLENGTAPTSEEYNALGQPVECFIGAVIYSDLKKYGVVYFSDTIPRIEPFDSYDMEFLQLFANWIGSEIGRTINEEQLQMAKEKAEAASKAKANFLSTISHEIRTPLNGIIGTSYLLLNKSPKPSQLEYIKMLKNSGENLLSIVNDVLDFNKIEQGKLQLEVVDMNLKELVESIVNASSLSAKDKDVDLQLDYSEDLKEYYGGDPTRISQVLNNLITNAIKFTSEGSVTVRLSKAEQMGGGDRVLFEVVDSGIGIKEEQQEKIFEEFTQADTSTSREYGGSGLGLSICQNLLRLMNSSIRLDSEYGRGSNFHFELTLPYSDPQAIQEQEDGLFSDNKSLDGVSILLVEDNKYNRVIAEDFLISWGAKVTPARDGGEAVEAIKSKSFDLVLMDLQMPNIDGYEATESIRQMAGNYFQNVPILALSASSLNRVKARAMSIGMNGFITKPFNPDEFFSKVKHAVSSNAADLEEESEASSRVNGGLDYIKQITKGSPTAMIKYLDLFVETMEESVVGFDKALKTKNVDDLAMLSHKVKSGLRSVGMMELGNRAEFFEETIDQGADIDELLPEVENYLVDLVKAIDSIREMRQQAEANS